MIPSTYGSINRGNNQSFREVLNNAGREVNERNK